MVKKDLKSKVQGQKLVALFLLLWTFNGGTSGPVAAPSNFDRGFFSVKDFGATGDGSTDDSAAFQAAINAAFALGGIVFIPPTPSGFLINTPLNLADRGSANHGIRIEGTGGPAFGYQGVLGPSMILANTGGVLFDITGSNNVTLSNFTISAEPSSLTNRSTVGVLIARSTTPNANAAHNVNLYDLGIYMNYNQVTPSVGVYNYQGELGSARNLWVTADYPVVYTLHNFLNITSPDTTIQTAAVSASMNSLDNARLLSSGKGPGLYFDTFYDFNGSNIYIENFLSASPYPARMVSYAVYALSSHNIHIQGRNEGFPTYLHAEGGVLDGLFIDATHAPSPAPPQHFVEFKGAGAIVRNCIFRIVPGYIDRTWAFDATLDAPNGPAFVNDEFYTYFQANGAQFTNAATVSFQSLRFYSAQSGLYPTITLTGATPVDVNLNDHILSSSFMLGNVSTILTNNSDNSISFIQAGPVKVGTSPIVLGSVTYSKLPVFPTNGMVIYCSNCDTPASPRATCTASADHAGAEAHYFRGAWRCY